MHKLLDLNISTNKLFIVFARIRFGTSWPREKWTLVMNGSLIQMIICSVWAIHISGSFSFGGMRAKQAHGQSAFHKIALIFLQKNRWQ
jgi:hypothetical protein